MKECLEKEGKQNLKMVLGCYIVFPITVWQLATSCILYQGHSQGGFPLGSEEPPLPTEVHDPHHKVKKMYYM